MLLKKNLALLTYIEPLFYNNAIIGRRLDMADELVVQLRETLEEQKRALCNDQGAVPTLFQKYVPHGFQD